MKWLVSYDIADTSTYHLLLHMMNDFTDILKDSDFMFRHDSFISEALWMLHQLICILHSYFHASTLCATNHSTIRKVTTTWFCYLQYASHSSVMYCLRAYLLPMFSATKGTYLIPPPPMLILVSIQIMVEDLVTISAPQNPRWLRLPTPFPTIVYIFQ